MIMTSPQACIPTLLFRSPAAAVQAQWANTLEYLVEIPDHEKIDVGSAFNDEQRMKMSMRFVKEDDYFVF